MALVTWDQTCSVSVRSMDEQHQKPFSLINNLHDAMRQGKGQEVVQDTVRESRRLYRYPLPGGRGAAAEIALSRVRRAPGGTSEISAR